MLGSAPWDHLMQTSHDRLWDWRCLCPHSVPLLFILSIPQWPHTVRVVSGLETHSLHSSLLKPSRKWKKNTLAKPRAALPATSLLWLLLQWGHNSHLFPLHPQSPQRPHWCLQTSLSTISPCHPVLRNTVTLPSFSVFAWIVLPGLSTPPDHWLIRLVLGFQYIEVTSSRKPSQT